MFESLRLRRRAGQPYDGPATYVDGNGQGDPRHGFYALTDDGKALRRPLVRLVAVAYPDGSHSYEIARKDDPPHRREGPLVPLEFAGQGQSGLETGGGHGAQGDPATASPQRAHETAAPEPDGRDDEPPRFSLNSKLADEARANPEGMRALVDGGSFDEQTRLALKVLLDEDVQDAVRRELP